MIFGGAAHGQTDLCLLEESQKNEKTNDSTNAEFIDIDYQIEETDNNISQSSREKNQTKSSLSEGTINDNIRDEISNHAKHDRWKTLDEAFPDPTQKSSTQRMAELDAINRYDRALLSLSEEQRQAVILRVEFGFTFPEIAQALEIPSPNAARMKVTRAMARLAEVMG